MSSSGARGGAALWTLVVAASVGHAVGCGAPDLYNPPLEVRRQMTDYDPADYQRFVQYTDPQRSLGCSPGNAIAAAEAALDDLGFDILSRGQDPYFIRTRSRGVAVPEFCDCGPPRGLAFSGEADSVFVVTLSPTSEGESTLSIENDCSRAMPEGGWFRCASVGFIELDFWDQLGRRVASSCK